MRTGNADWKKQSSIIEAVKAEISDYQQKLSVLSLENEDLQKENADFNFKISRRKREF